MGQIRHYNNGKWTVYTSGEELTTNTGTTNTYYVGPNLTDGIYTKVNPNGQVINLESGGGGNGGNTIRKEIFDLQVGGTAPVFNLRDAIQNKFGSTYILPSIYFDCFWEFYDDLGVLIDTDQLFIDQSALETYVTNEMPLHNDFIAIKVYIKLNNEKPKIIISGRNQGYWQMRGVRSYFNDRFTNSKSVHDMPFDPPNNPTNKQVVIDYLRLSLDSRIGSDGKGLNYVSSSKSLYLAPPKRYVVGDPWDLSWVSAKDNARYIIRDSDDVLIPWTSGLGTVSWDNIRYFQLNRNGIAGPTPDSLEGRCSVTEFSIGGNYTMYVIKPDTIDTLLLSYVSLEPTDKIVYSFKSSLLTTRLYEATLEERPADLFGPLFNVGTQVQKNRLGNLHIEDLISGKSAYNNFMVDSNTSKNIELKFMYGSQGIFTESDNILRIYKATHNKSSTAVLDKQRTNNDKYNR